MKARTMLALSLATALAAPVILAGDKDESKTKMIKCEMTFSLSGWSAFYNTAKGEGTITCDNGQTAKVKIKSDGGGITFGKSKIVDGKGVFSTVQKIDELFGSYATAEAHAGAVKGGTAQALTKGEVSLALSGSGSGWDIGINFGRFKITRVS